MALMKKSALSFVMIVALVATCFIKLHARVEFIADQGGKSSSGGGEPCCDKCVCIQPLPLPPVPPRCQCTDVGVDCHPGCKQCICALSYPRQCRCTDIKTYCDKKCTAPYAPTLEAIATVV